MVEKHIRYKGVVIFARNFLLARYHAKQQRSKFMYTTLPCTSMSHLSFYVITCFVKVESSHKLNIKIIQKNYQMFDKFLKLSLKKKKKTSFSSR